MIYILSAPIRSGKTTSLINWSAAKKDVYGILTPEVNGKRVFMNAQSKDQFPMEANGKEEALSIGRFLFSKANFDKAVQIIHHAIDKEGWLVIDEIGPLELQGEGFCEIVKEALLKRPQKLLLVIRDKEDTVEKVKKYFDITDPVIINNINGLGE